MYKVQFVGAICFLRQNGSRLALLPDGSDIRPKHLARIVVDPGMVTDEANWPRRNRVQRNLGEYRLPSCTVTLSGVDQPGQLDTSDHERRMPRLQNLQPLFRIDPNLADTVATIPIRQGTLIAFRYPKTLDEPDASIISELRVNHDGPITVVVTPRDGSAVRTLLLEPGTEIAIANDTPDDESIAEHFQIYEKLADDPRARLEPMPPPNPPRLLPPSRSEHRIFNGIIDDDLQCPNTGCCP